MKIRDTCRIQTGLSLTMNLRLNSKDRPDAKRSIINCQQIMYLRRMESLTVTVALIRQASGARNESY